MKRVNVNIFPKEGYFFRESDGAIIRASNWASVMRKVESYRKRNRMPPGNPEAEVGAQACSRNPSHCSEENDALIQQRKVVSLKGRVLSYLSFLRGLLVGNRIPWVSAAVAANRAGVCAGCSNNTPLPEGCSSCAAAVRAMVREIVGPNRATDSRLNGCAALGEYLQASVHVDHEVVDDPALPAHCWRKRRVP